MHGFDIDIPNQLTKHKVTYNYDNFADHVRNAVATARELAKEGLQKRREKNKKQYDKNSNDCEINVGDKVLIKNMAKNHKFDSLYLGPYEVVNAEDVYVEVLKKGKRAKYHKNLIKKSTS